MAKEKKKILITGANGFIGLNAVKSFVSDDSFDIYALVHKNISEELKNLKTVKIIQADITNENIADKLPSFDIVIHIAGLARDIGKDEKFKKLNFDSVRYAAKIAKEKFIYISSTDVYGIKDFIDAKEDTPYHNFPNNPYPKYKIEAEKYVIKNCQNYVIIRPAAVYGKNDKTLEKRVVVFLKSSPFIIHFGKHRGKNRWPLANVDNISKVLLYTAKYDDFNNLAINIIDPEKTTIDEYYNNVAKKYFPQKKFKTLYLPMFLGKLIGLVSTVVSNLLNLHDAVFDPTYYAVHHVSSNLDFSCERMNRVLEMYEKKFEK